VKHQFRGNKSHIERTLDDTDAASVATGLIPTEQRLGSRKPKVARQILSWIQDATDEPDRLTLTDFREDDAPGEPFATIGAQQADTPCGQRGHIAPGQVGHEFVADGKSDTLPYQQIPREVRSAR
jgi:hypothetical protein